MGLPVIKISELNANSIKNAKFYEGEYQEKYRLNTGDVLFAWSASLGIYLWTHGEALLNQHIFNVQPNGTYSKSFLYFLLKYVINEFKDIAAARATTMGHIKKEHLQSRYVPYPTVDFLRKTEDIFADLYSKILANEVENNYLKETRDYLLPRLLSGEIELKEAEKQVEEML
ncbi:Type I restriction modification DNA specificity domain [Chlamydia trachomatis]|nr:Type I restriction modification DNA specificity domain [Chlamydia trachomatis]